MSTLQTTGFLTFWLLSAFASAEVADYVLSHEEAAVILPRAPLDKPLLSALGSIPWQEHELAKVKSLLLTSGQSRTASGGRVLNRIHFFDRGRFDLWLMKQEGAGRGLQFHHWNRIAIAVDKTASPATAYFFELGREASGEKGLPTFKAFTAACLTCHANGPRLIRPEGNEIGQPFTQGQKELLKTWNQKIQNYRFVRNFRPAWEGRSILDSPAPLGHEVLHLKACEECHSTQSQVRGPLERQHAESILYLSTHQEMPLEGHALSDQALQCLKAWLDQDVKTLKSGPCTLTGDLAESSASAWVLDPVHSWARAQASTKLGPIKVSNFQMMGSGQCNDTHLCHAHLEVGLKDLKSGISLRDEHLQRLLGFPSISNAEIQFDGALPFEQRQSVKALLKFQHREKVVPLIVTCHRQVLGPRCAVAFDLELTDWGIDPPAFLGLTVDPHVKIEGTFAFQTHSD